MNSVPCDAFPKTSRSVRLNLVVVHETGLTRPLYSLDRATLENVDVASRAALDLLRDDEGFYYYGVSQRRDDDVSNPYRRRLIVSREYCANGDRWKRLLLDAFDRSNGSDVYSAECAVTLYRETTVTVVALRRLAKTGRIVSTKYVREDVNLSLQALNSRQRIARNNMSQTSEQSMSENVDIVATNEFAKHTSCDNGSHDLSSRDEHATACVACLDCFWVDTLAETAYFDDDDAAATKIPKIPKSRRHEVLEVPRFFLYRESCYDFSHIRGCVAAQSCATIANLGKFENVASDYCPWHAWVDVHLTWLRRYILDDWTASFGPGTTHPTTSPLNLQTREAIWRDIRQNGFFTCGLYEVAFVEIVDDSDERDDYRRALLLFERDDFALLPLPAFSGDDSYDDDDVFRKFGNVAAEWIPRRFAYVDVSSVTMCMDERESNLNVFFARTTKTRPYEFVRRVPSARFFGKSGIRVRPAPTDRPFRAKTSSRSDRCRDSLVMRNVLSNLEYMSRWYT